MTYNYGTGQISRDFVLKKVEGNCDMDPNHTKLIGVMCQVCPYYLRMNTFYRSSKEEYKLNLDGKIGTFVFCKFHKKDDESARDAIHIMYEKFRDDAITHYYD